MHIFWVTLKLLKKQRTCTIGSIINGTPRGVRLTNKTKTLYWSLTAVTNLTFVIMGK